MSTSAQTQQSPANIDQLCINTIRTLAMDAVQQANSGHPGTPMAMAPVIYSLWQNFLSFDPDDPIWPNRDRFVLSMGHASTLLYSMLHLTQVKAVNPEYESLGKPSVTLEDVKNFRQLDSKCPGHPEYRWTSGIETTTGPLGQGVATSVGMAVASRWMGQYFNRPSFDMIGFDVYALAGDGCMMEGVSGEAASLAGHLKLSNLCWIYDNNHISIEGNTSLSYSDDVATRFVGYGWNVTRVGDANDQDMLKRAFKCFQDTKDRPTLIIVDSHIAYGAPHKQDTSAAHGEPLGDEEIRLTKRVYGWPEDAKFLVPDGVYDRFQELMGQRGRGQREAWMAKFGEYSREYPELAGHLLKMQKRELPDGWDTDIPNFPADAKGMGGRDSSAKVQNAIAKRVPWLIGGSADLAPSTKTRLTFDGAGDFSATDYSGRNFHFGIREHAMGSMLNGMSLSKARVYGSGFLIFSDYMRAPIRLSALMEIPVIYIFTHDSIGVGEDGPTHQPVEQLISLRAIPGIDCDASGRCQRSCRGLAHHHEVPARTGLPDSLAAEYADVGSDQICTCVRRGERRLHFSRRERQRPGSDSARYWQRSRAVRGCVRAVDQGWNKSAGGQHSFVGTVRSSEPGISGSSAASEREGARFSGTGVDIRMGALRPPEHWHVNVWSIGAVEGTAEKVRVYAGCGGGGGEGRDRESAGMKVHVLLEADSFVGQVGNLRPIGNRPAAGLGIIRGRLPIGRRMPSCPTKENRDSRL